MVETIAIYFPNRQCVRPVFKRQDVPHPSMFDVDGEREPRVKLEDESGAPSPRESH
jgi:hypothetical protein